MAQTYPPDWDQRRRRVYERDNYTCQNCGIEGGPAGDAELHAHHVVPLEKEGSNELSNLKTLCAKCHEAVHQDEAMARTADASVRDENRPLAALSESEQLWVIAAGILYPVFGTFFVGLFLESLLKAQLQLSAILFLASVGYVKYRNALLD